MVYKLNRSFRPKLLMLMQDLKGIDELSRDKYVKIVSDSLLKRGLLKIEMDIGLE